MRRRLEAMARDKLDDCPCREGSEGPLEHCPAHGNPRYFAELLEKAERRIADLRATNTQRSYIIDGQDRELARLRRWRTEALKVLKAWDDVAEMIEVECGSTKSSAVGAYITQLESENVKLMTENSRLMVAVWEGREPKQPPTEGPSLADHLDIT